MKKYFDLLQWIGIALISFVFIIITGNKSGTSLLVPFAFFLCSFFASLILSIKEAVKLYFNN